MPGTSHVTLPGSERARILGLERLGPVPGEDSVEVTVVLRRRAPLPADVATGRRTLTRQELAEQHGAGEQDAERVRAVLQGAGLSVSEVDPASRRIVAGGTADAVRALFGTDLEQVWDPVREVRHRYRTGPLTVPLECADSVVAVLGVDDRPQAETPLRLPSAGSTGTGYTPLQLGAAYGFPEGTDGSGQTVGIVELGGGYRQQDLDDYFRGLGLKTPAVRSVGVDGKANDPGKQTRVDTEVTLDIEVAGALAPGAEYVVYFAPNSDKGFLDAVSKAAHADPTPAAISISWGQSEDTWSAQSRTALDQALADAAALGVTVCVASGDHGSSDAASDGRSHVDFPAASPHALGCGGTTLQLEGKGTVRSETVWNNQSGGGSGGGATGGGVSGVFDLPAWQQHAGVPEREGGGTGRGVPDVAADADPHTGYRILVGGKPGVVGGTSAAAPLWAALVARLVQGTGSPLGLAQSRFYDGISPQTAVPGFRDVTSGDNGAFHSGPGWDPCTGLGSPDGTALLQRLRLKG